MGAMTVEIRPEIEQLVFEISGRPEQHAVQVFASDGAILWRFPLCGVRSDNAAAGIACTGSNAT